MSWLSNTRAHYGVTQRQIALALGMTDQAVSNWERRDADPRLTYNQWSALCRLFGCSFEDLGERIRVVQQETAGLATGND